MDIIKVGLYLLSCLQKTSGFSEQVVANLRERYISECRTREGAAFFYLITQNNKFSREVLSFHGCIF